MFISKGNDEASSRLTAISAIKGSVYKQAMVPTYNDVFLMVGIFFSVCIPLLLLFRLKSKCIVKVEHKVEMHWAD
ncbi:MAG: hypothetical protein ACHQK8_06000 [Bacteroidia bacterium]